MALKYNKYLITGGAGFIGSHICEELVKQGKEIVVIDNLRTGILENIKPFWLLKQCKFVKADISNYEAISHHFKGVDVVFHNAASKCTVCRKDPYVDLMTNAWGSLNVFKAAQEHGVKKVIHASTGSVNNNKPKSFYGVSKMTAEKYLEVMKEYYPDSNYTILRYYHVYGTRQDDSDNGGVIPIFIRRIWENKPVIIYGDGEQERHFTSVKDVVKANFAVSENDDFKYNHINIVSDVKITIRKLSWMIHFLMERPNERIEYAPAKQGDIKKFNFVKYFLNQEPNIEVFPLGFQYNNDLRGELGKVIEWYIQKYESRQKKSRNVGAVADCRA